MQKYNATQKLSLYLQMNNVFALFCISSRTARARPEELYDPEAGCDVSEGEHGARGGGRRGRDAASPVPTTVPPARNHHFHPGGSPSHIPGSPRTSPRPTQRPQWSPPPTYAKGTIN